MQQNWQWNMAPWKILFLYEQAIVHFHDCWRVGLSLRTLRLLPTEPAELRGARRAERLGSQSTSAQPRRRSRGHRSVSPKGAGALHSLDRRQTPPRGERVPGQEPKQDLVVSGKRKRQRRFFWLLCSQLECT